MELKLYAIPGSHPCRAVEAALDAKGLEYERVDMLPGLSPLHQLATFGKRTVPAMKIGGDKVVGSRLIMHTLDGMAPEPPLYPSDPLQRAAVERAEQWADETLQTSARWATIYAIAQRPESTSSFMVDAGVPNLPEPILAPLTRAIFTAELRVLAGGTGGAERALAALPGELDHADALIADGVIGGAPPNAADLQIAASVRLLVNLADLREAIDARPCGELARRLFPDYAGEVPRGALPAGWTAGLAREGAAA